jgi:hypothetical protein
MTPDAVARSANATELRGGTTMCGRLNARFFALLGALEQASSMHKRSG